VLACPELAKDLDSFLGTPAAKNISSVIFFSAAAVNVGIFFSVKGLMIDDC
jgi:hypothetical protein